MRTNGFDHSAKINIKDGGKYIHVLCLKTQPPNTSYNSEYPAAATSASAQIGSLRMTPTSYIRETLCDIGRTMLRLGALPTDSIR